MASIITSFAGVSTPAFLIVEKVGFSVLPSSQVKTLDVPMKSGSYFINQKYGIRTFSVDFTIKADTAGNVMYFADDLAEWLHYDEPQKLIFRDKPDQYYMAMVSGETDLTKFGVTGKGRIEFVCYDPHGYSINEKTITLANSAETTPLMLTNNGNMKTAPIIEMQFTKNLTDFAITTDNQHMYFGEPFDETEKTATDLKPLIINDTGASVTGWTGGLSVDGGQVMGTLASNGYSISQGGTPRSYGTLSGLWHGGSLIKSLGKQVQDFSCEAQIGFLANNKVQKGRVEIYLLDINNNKLGKIALKDVTASGDHPVFDAWVGQYKNGGVSVINSYGDKKGTFAQFNGVIRVSRTGKKWEFYIAKVDSNGKHTSRMYKAYTDWKNQYSTKVASMQIHIAQYDASTPVDQMWISNIRFVEKLTKTSTQVDYVFRTNDKLRIDCTNGEILLNGEPFYDELYPSSSFFLLDKGVNGISISDQAIKNGTIKFTERWL